jgi:hypothetical protein
MPRDMSQHRRAVLPSLLLLLLSAQRGTERSLQTREHPHRPARQSDKIVAAASELHSLAAARQHARWLTRVSRYDTCCLTAQPQTLSDVPAALTDARPEQLRRGNPLAVAPARALLVFRHRVADAASPHAVLAHESCLLVLLLPLLLRVAGRWWCRRARMRSAKAGTLCVCVCVCVCGGRGSPMWPSRRVCVYGRGITGCHVRAQTRQRVTRTRTARSSLAKRLLSWWKARSKRFACAAARRSCCELQGGGTRAEERV